MRLFLGSAVAKLKGREEKAEEEEEKRFFQAPGIFQSSAHANPSGFSHSIPAEPPGSPLGASFPLSFSGENLWNDKALVWIQPWGQPGIHQQWQPGDKMPCWKFGKEEKCGIAETGVGFSQLWSCRGEETEQTAKGGALG